MTLVWTVLTLGCFTLIFWHHPGYLIFLKLLINVKKDKSQVDLSLSTPKPLKVTVIIPTYNEEKHILRKIKNTLAVDYPGELKEIIIIDSASKDGTVREIEKILKRVGGFKFIQQSERRGKASALNLAIAQAQGDVILTTDANCLLNKESLGKIVPHFSDPQVGGVCGKFEIAKTGKEFEGGSNIYWQIEESMRRSESCLDSTIHMSGEIATFRRGLALYDEENLAEDFELAVAIRKKGYRIIYEPEAVASEEIPEGTKGLTTQKKRSAIGTIQTIRRHRQVLFNPRYGWYGLLILPSHKLLQILLPWIFLLGAISLQFFLWQFRNLGTVRRFFVFEIVGTLILIFLNLLLPKLEIKPIKIVEFWLLAQWIIALAWVDYFRNNFRVNWVKTNRV